jgi:hypothetical protein
MASYIYKSRERKITELLLLMIVGHGELLMLCSARCD